MLPDIQVPDLPDNPAQYLTYLQSLALFDIASYSQEDSKRTIMYQSEMQRKQAAKQFAPFYYDRIAQLPQRSNQFNLRTVRYTESEIAAIAQDDRYVTLYFTLKDRFGDHGLVSVVILEKQESALWIDTWPMSCRVLKRGMEALIVNCIMDTALRHGYTSVIGEYLKTAKNNLVKDIYPEMGFSALENNWYVAFTQSYAQKTTYIKVVNQ